MDLEKVMRSLVAVRASIPDNAFTADTLGTRREGSGVVIRENGLVLTIGYLITEAEDVWLTRHDGQVVPAHPLVYDQESGFGLVQALAPLDLPPIEIGDSNLADVGDAIVVADGEGQYVRGNIVAKQEFAGYWEYLLDEAIFTTPAHPSWGGAALIDDGGQLVGIGSLRLQMSKGGEIADINMIVPINLVKPILDGLLHEGEFKRPPRPWLGAMSAETNGEVVVMSVTENGPAARGGLRRGDVISEIRDGEVDGLADFYRKIWDSGAPGAEIPMRVLRDGREAWLRIKSADRNDFLRKPQLQ
ncbi:signal protein PDZ (plasmid) [Neorhizobium sp. SOG26]|uniref:S1C family serine protease n=1 Tax=Neorhizobium turbinariae TaxID=2937795 RepID=A0ABT0IN59_9HYPH|nr:MULTISPECIES: S1C family serine protease [Neorhizobium]AXV17952.1 signal protein PDZ [Neorhizobium sp. SOG26]MCK8779286.1 S1C family serine protease [Neorhizobium turbinariae]